VHAIDRDDARGAFNATAPDVVRNTEFARTLGRVLSRPAFLPAPKFALRIALGEVAQYLTESERCVPEHALRSGFVFQHKELEPALRDLLGTRTQASRT
jgi:NAD dependent epimerase/dehydratase family enzyme